MSRVTRKSFQYLSTAEFFGTFENFLKNKGRRAARSPVFTTYPQHIQHTQVFSVALHRRDYGAMDEVVYALLSPRECRFLLHLEALKPKDPFQSFSEFIPYSRRDDVLDIYSRLRLAISRDHYSQLTASLKRVASYPQSKTLLKSDMVVSYKRNKRIDPLVN